MKKFSLIKSTLNHNLCTIKAIKHIQMADLLIVDKYTDQKLYHYAKKECSIIQYDYKRAAFNLPIAAQKIVRLTEEITSTSKTELDEIELFRNLGYDAELIPGISIINGVTGENYFPLTIRGRNESFWVYDSRIKRANKKEIYNQLTHVAESSATLIILTNLLSNLEKQLKPFMVAVSQYRCLETPVLCCLVTGEIVHTTIKEVLYYPSKNKRAYMLVINPSVATAKRTLCKTASIQQAQMAI